MRGQAFNQPIAPWDMSKVTTTEYSACISFSGHHDSSSPMHPIHPIIPSRHWRTERMWIRVEYIHSTVAWLFVLRGAVRVVDHGRAKTGGVAVWCGRAVFYKAAAFNQPIGQWDMSSVTTTRMSACIFFPGLHASSSPMHPIVSSHRARTGSPCAATPLVGGAHVGPRGV